MQRSEFRTRTPLWKQGLLPKSMLDVSAKPRVHVAKAVGSPHLLQVQGTAKVAWNQCGLAQTLFPTPSLETCNSLSLWSAWPAIPRGLDARRAEKLNTDSCSAARSKPRTLDSLSLQELQLRILGLGTEDSLADSAMHCVQRFRPQPLAKLPMRI